MDSLFIMQRYWASDEEANNEEESKSILNFDISEENSEPHKKEKADSSVTGSDINFSVEKSHSDEDSSNYIEVVTEKTVSPSKIVNGKEKALLKKEKRCKAQQIQEQSLKVSVTESDRNFSVEKSHSDEDSSNYVEVVTEKSVSSSKIVNGKEKALLKKEKRCKPQQIQEQSLKISVTESDRNFSVEKSHSDEDSSNYVEVITEKSVSPSKIVNGKEKALLKKKKRCEPQQIQEQKRDTEELNISNSQVEHIGEVFSTIGQVQSAKAVKVRHALPYWLSNPTYINVNLLEEETPISELNYLDSNSKRNLQEEGINYLFPVQLAVIPWLMQSKEQCLLIRPSDICVSAPTGSGKTLAFVLPIVQSLKDRVVCAIRALVVLPVNELAFQVFKVFERFVRGTDLKVVLLTGQKSFIAEQNALIRSNGQKVQSMVDIIVTTPGRIYDHIYKTKGFCLKRLRYLVIDEADRMLEEIQQGWLKQVESAVFNECVFSNCVCSSLSRTSHEPSSAYNFGIISHPLQKLLYSATLTQDPEQLHSLSLYKPKLFTASSLSDEQIETCAIPPGLTMLQIVCGGDVKPMVICQFVKCHNFKRVLCFTETVERAHRLHLVLEEMGLLQVREISSSNRAIQRKIVLEQFSSGKVDILVCSDLVARGIDIENIDCVISYDIPQSIKIYIHRVGRTARAGKTGKAVTLLTDGEVPHFKKMLKSAGIEIPKKININSEELKPLINSYQSALMKADAKLRKEKNQLSGRPAKKIKRK